LRTPLFCTSCLNSQQVIISMTYSLMKRKLLPPPYDTNCQDYRKTTNFTSSDNCLSQCVTDFTSRLGMIIESNVLTREKYENSSLILISWYFKTLHDGKKSI